MPSDTRKRRATSCRVPGRSSQADTILSLRSNESVFTLPGGYSFS
jgi:hypothetical protein